MQQELFQNQMNNKIFSDRTGALNLYPDFIVDSGEVFKKLFSNINWQSNDIFLFGKKYKIPRLHAWYADPKINYSYSNILMNRNDWTPLLIELKNKVEEKMRISFNGVLLNYYRDGSDCNGWHSDDERELKQPIEIACLSFGAEREMGLRLKAETKMKFKINLKAGSLLIMHSPIQENWQHSILKTKKNIDARMSLTFRQIEI